MMAVSADKMSLITVFDQPSINRACKGGSRQHVKFDKHVRNDLLDAKVKQAITLALRAASSSELFGKMLAQQDWESWHRWDNDMFFPNDRDGDGLADRGHQPRRSVRLGRGRSFVLQGREHNADSVRDDGAAASL